ncbi:DNA-binding transcriptional regulator, MerR family [Rhodococcus rhodochrous J3]|uniref:HEAT repeat domain-containing protein n=2 Tax=Rhodococcus rhodochrous TaxID=1829 RepID=A0AA46WS96_RHORH|nr:HEAT repeat domain-containing protein [Rhodococcus rhodochrous]MBF4477087.1 HEAT repeat domain-containing protein [Rhodococcus rhodochrous]MCB8908943.1 HEAT repeat domain-containing protein [Rhodococcus rhodochrous]MDJ0398172.1 HEAT repeat domain-containing protein [Rhodococcus rhodochrous]MDO1482563.1 MerR family transcriptional regulator [Rhodococcus rhodochrous]UZF43363.1 HEAT repeat domain-containing protein [Rhodococcus rhodochrous]
MLIGEVSRRSGVSTRMLRHYDRLGLVTPTGRTSGGYREYTEDDLRRLFHVESLRSLGLSLNEVGRALGEPDFAPAELVQELIAHTRERIAAETELLARLEGVDSLSPTGWDDVLRLVALLRAFESDSGSRRQQAILSQDAETTLPVAALVRAALSEEDPFVAGALRWSLARADAIDAALPALAEGLRSDDVPVRRRAIATLAELRVPESTTLLEEALDDDDPRARSTAALTLGARGVNAAVPVLVEMIVEGQSDVEAAEVLGVLADRPLSSAEIVRSLRHALGGSDDAGVRLRLTQALAEIPGSAAHDALEALTDDPDRTVAATARVVLTSRKAP